MKALLCLYINKIRKDKSIKKKPAIQGLKFAIMTDWHDNLRGKGGNASFYLKTAPQLENSFWGNQEKDIFPRKNGQEL
jgi:hypothetical protein